MCGIVGIFSFDAPPPHRELWPIFINHLGHRGPDEGAWWADDSFFLGHRRLAILDPETGGQPMATQDGSLVVVFNGEIYNFPELRSELEKKGYVFHTNSDTEVLIHGYHAWKEELPSRLTGMFSFAIADRRRKELFLARDRFGEKPLFLMHTKKYIAFASELRPFAAFPDFSRSLDVEALGGYLSLNYVPGTGTLMKGIRRLAPATWTLISRYGEQCTGTYWSPPDTTISDQGESIEEALEEWRDLFDKAVQYCLLSDVPVGILLSGGVDSALVAESAMRQGNLSCAYFLDFEEKSYSEYNAAKEVARRLSLPLERITLTSESLKNFFQLVEHADDPLADSSALPVWTISQLAAQGNKVVLGGDGGDELFGGYLTFRASQIHARVFSRLPMLLRKGFASWSSHIPTGEKKVTFSFKLRRFLRAADLSLGLAHLSWNGTWLPHEATNLIAPGPDRETVRNALPKMVNGLGLEGNPANLLLSLQRMDIADYLPNDILTKVDRMSMAHSLETRAPFLNHTLAEWALKRPEQQKIGPGGELKRILRYAARKTFGTEIADRPKKGFSIPIHTWIRGPLGDVVRDLLSAESIKRVNILDYSQVETVIDDHFSGRRSYGFELWGLAVLMAWHRARIENTPRPPKEMSLVERRFIKP